MKKLIIVAVAALGVAGMPTAANAQVIRGTFNTGSDAESDNSSSMDIRFGPCPNDSALTCGTAVRSVAADGSTNRGVTLRPSDNFDYNNGEPFALENAILLRNLRPVGERNGNQRWEGGLFYNPATLREFDGVFAELRPDGNLDVGGCVLVFCQSTTFTRLN